LIYNFRALFAPKTIKDVKTLQEKMIFTQSSKKKSTFLLKTQERDDLDSF